MLAQRSPRSRWALAAALAGLLCLTLAPWARPAHGQGGSVVVLSISGPITPPHSLYLQRSLDQADRAEAEVVILRLDTPGGQVDLMNRLVALIRDSDVPVVVYVAPRGAMAASAGTVITLAGHASAMAPETVIGAASPVGGEGEDLDNTSETKIKEVLKAQARSLAAGRPPEAIALAEATIEEARTATADEAYAVGLVDFIAADLPDLLRQLNGHTVRLDGRPYRLATAGLPQTEVSLSLVEQVLALLTNPNIVFLLLSFGSLALLTELASPGGWVAGAVGVVCLALAFYGLGVLPVNWFGLVFVGLAFVLFIMEVQSPAHGGLAAAGTGALIAGALVLFNSPGAVPYFRVSVPLVIATSLLLAAGMVVLMTVALRAQRRPVTSGVEGLVGRVAEVRTSSAVHVDGELWSAEPTEPSAVLVPGEKVVVAEVRGLRLRVRPLPEDQR